MKDEVLEKLSDLFGETISKFFTMNRLVLLLIEDKVRSLEIKLTEAQKKKIVKLLQESNFEEVTIKPNRQQKVQIQKLGLEEISLEINEADISKLETRIQEIIEDVSKNTLDNMLNSTTDKLIKEWKKQANPILGKLRNERKRFNNYNNKIWGKALNLLETLIDISLDTGMLFNEKFRPIAAKENDITFDALARLHARS